MSSDQFGKQTRTIPWGTRPNATQRLSVLFADASREHSEGLARALPPGWSWTVVTMAHSAMNAIHSQIPTVVVSELDLPDASGLEFVTRLHLTPATRHVLLMVVTQRSTISDKIAAFQAGVDDYLVKPVDPSLFSLHVQLLSRLRPTL